MLSGMIHKSNLEAAQKIERKIEIDEKKGAWKPKWVSNSSTVR